MDVVPLGSLLQIIAFFALLPLSMLFSASETALISLTESELNELRNSKNKKDQKIYKSLTENSEFLLISLLLGNTIVNISIATIAALFTHTLLSGTPLEGWGMLIEVFVVGIIILLFGEIIPKSYAIRNRISFSRKMFPLVMFFYSVFYILTYIISKIVNLFIGRFKGVEGITAFTRKDIENLMEVGEEEGALEEDEKNMINSIFEFGETTVKEIMVPRVDMKSIEDEIDLPELLEFINENNFSRIPVYNENIDNIIGILYIKDLLHFINKKDEKFIINSIVRDVTFIPESKDIGDLLKMFQKDKIHIAIVVDEYGGTAGMITLEDIIEEIVGEIQDEFDTEDQLYKKLSETVYEFDAKIPVDDINDILGINLPEDEDYESLGGYLYDIFGEVPEVGDKKEAIGLSFKILSVTKQRIGLVKVEILEKNKLDLK
ncbi:MAG: hemolysin family protein [Candidatus Delongbacteria bacterium]|jgi:putative hemolysin|nr:hemolysin family protein [Candidatus Delongbacteria bacterium]